MKKQIFSAILGGTFFAVPYLALNVPVVASAVFAGAAYGAGLLIFQEKGKNKLTYHTDNLYDILNEAKEKNAALDHLLKEIENKDLTKDVQEIYDISSKIIDTISKKPEKLEAASQFLNYYLPVTIKILTRYDEIENQKLNSKESEQFMDSIQTTVKKVKDVFHKQLSNLYQSDMIDTDAEIKVFESMLKTDGFIENSDFEIKTKDPKKGGK